MPDLQTYQRQEGMVLSVWLLGKGRTGQNNPAKQEVIDTQQKIGNAEETTHACGDGRAFCEGNGQVDKIRIQDGG